jgi:hypothetical protein|tara:strand:- start:497 stop:619 length:123 start_codon:yes stop_codon:yes gene_type:complete
MPYSFVFDLIEYESSELKSSQINQGEVSKKDRYFGGRELK